MSLETLRQMQRYYMDEDAATDAREVQRYKARGAKLSQEEIVKQGEELYAKVVSKIKKEYNLGKSSFLVSCKLRPNPVFDYVVEKLRAKGWKAEHDYNDGYNAYDFIEVKPSIESL